VHLKVYANLGWPGMTAPKFFGILVEL
jgi:hypothetical protein